MSLLEEYPKTNRDEERRLRSILAGVPGLLESDRGEFADAISNLADKACDLEEIFQRLLRGPANADELADLLIAFEMTLEQIRGESDTVDGKLYEMADQLRSPDPGGDSSMSAEEVLRAIAAYLEGRPSVVEIRTDQVPSAWRVGSGIVPLPPTHPALCIGGVPIDLRLHQTEKGNWGGELWLTIEGLSEVKKVVAKPQDKAVKELGNLILNNLDHLLRERPPGVFKRLLERRKRESQPNPDEVE